MRAKTFLAVWTAALLTGCVSLPLNGRADLLEFLAEGETTQAEVILKLGQPAGRFEREKILAYRLGFTPKNKGYFVVEGKPGARPEPTWKNVTYSLVLVFDERDILRKPSLVEVR